MSKKHFIAIARALKDSGANSVTVKMVADELRQFNCNFDRQRFIDAATS